MFYIATHVRMRCPCGGRPDRMNLRLGVARTNWCGCLEKGQCYTQRQHGGPSAMLLCLAGCDPHTGAACAESAPDDSNRKPLWAFRSARRGCAVPSRPGFRVTATRASSVPSADFCNRIYAPLNLQDSVCEQSIPVPSPIGPERLQQIDGKRHSISHGWDRNYGRIVVEVVAQLTS